MKNSGDNVFESIPVGQDEAALFNQFLAAHDFAVNSRKAMTTDLRKFASWFGNANHEPFKITRTTVADLTDFRDWLRREKKQAVATVNRCLVTLRRILRLACRSGTCRFKPCQAGQGASPPAALAPKGLDRSQVRRLLREAELRGDLRANAVFSLFLWTGCRVSDLVNLELTDLMLGDAHWHGRFPVRQGKQTTFRAIAAPSSPCPASLPRHPPASPKSEGVYRRARGFDRAWRKSHVRQVFGAHRGQFASAPASPHDGAPIPGRQWQ